MTRPARRKGADPKPPVGPWIAAFRSHLREKGIRAPEPWCGAVESHVLWYVSAVLTDRRLDARARAAVRDTFLSVGIADLRGHDGGATSRGTGSPTSPRAAWMKEETNEKREEEDDAT